MIASIEPATLRLGTAWNWRRVLPQYPAPAWVLRYYLKNAAGSITIETRAEGLAHRVELRADETRDHAPGVYALIGHASDELGQVVEVVQRSIELLARVDTDEALDTRTRAVRILADLEAAYAEYVAGTGQGAAMVQSYVIDGRGQTFRSSQELLDQIDYWRGRVAQKAERQAAREGRASPRNLYIQLERP